MSVTRRQLLVGGGAATAAVLLGSGVLAACGADDEARPEAGSDDSTAEATIPEGVDPDAVGLAAIGASYVATTDDIATREDAEAALELDPGSDLTPSELLAERADAIHADFEAGEVVELDGWVFSVTEARIAALAAFDADAVTDEAA
jgi:hypothetical protein